MEDVCVCDMCVYAKWVQNAITPCIQHNAHSTCIETHPTSRRVQHHCKRSHLVPQPCMQQRTHCNNSNLCNVGQCMYLSTACTLTLTPAGRVLAVATPAKDMSVLTYRPCTCDECVCVRVYVCVCLEPCSQPYTCEIDCPDCVPCKCVRSRTRTIPVASVSDTTHYGCLSRASEWSRGPEVAGARVAVLVVGSYGATRVCAKGLLQTSHTEQAANTSSYMCSYFHLHFQYKQPSYHTPCVCK